MYRFDSDLRAIFLKYILIVENNIKSSISYHFSSLYGNGISYYTDKKNYEYGNRERDILYLFKKMNAKIRNKHVSLQIEHYLKAYHDIPLWVLAIDLTMGEIATMYRYLKGHCKTLVCNDFHGIINYNAFISHAVFRRKRMLKTKVLKSKKEKEVYGDIKLILTIVIAVLFSVLIGIGGF